MTTTHLTTSTDGSESCKTMGGGEGEGTRAGVKGAGEVKVSKDADGWWAETRIELGGQRLLRLVTCKHRQGGVATRGSVANIEGDVLVTTMGRDYSRIYKHEPKARCTEKTVKEFHSYHLGMLPSIQREISRYYNPHPWVVVAKPGQSDESILGEFCEEAPARDLLLSSPSADLMKRTDDGLLTTEF